MMPFPFLLKLDDKNSVQTSMTWNEVSPVYRIKHDSLHKWTEQQRASLLETVTAELSKMHPDAHFEGRWVGHQLYMLPYSG